MKTWYWILGIAFVLFTLYVWPTRFAYHSTVKMGLLRVDRLTGEITLVIPTVDRTYIQAAAARQREQEAAKREAEEFLKGLAQKEKEAIPDQKK